MKTIIKLAVIAACAAGSLATVQAQTIADWTFETSQPGVVDGPAAPGADNWITNITAEVGSGTAGGQHLGASTYSSPSGNGSTRSFSSTTWAVGDFYQFAVSTTGYNNITLSYDQTSSNTGPGVFQLAYSTDGINFTFFGSTYTVLANAAPNTAWTPTTYNSAYTFTDNLSGVTALNGDATVYFRLVDEGTTSANGGTVASGGTDRVDNFDVVSAPEPTTLALAGVGGLACLVAARRRS